MSQIDKIPQSVPYIWLPSHCAKNLADVVWIVCLACTQRQPRQSILTHHFFVLRLRSAGIRYLECVEKGGILQEIPKFMDVVSVGFTCNL